MKQFYEAYVIAANSFAQAVNVAISQNHVVDINGILYNPTEQKFQLLLESIKTKRS